MTNKSTLGFLAPGAPSSGTHQKPKFRMPIAKPIIVGYFISPDGPRVVFNAKDYDGVIQWEGVLWPDPKSFADRVPNYTLHERSLKTSSLTLAQITITLDHVQSWLRTYLQLPKAIRPNIEFIANVDGLEVENG